MISVIILTFNSELTIGQTLASARKVSDDIHVVDSFSKDSTCQIVTNAGARLVQHPFEHYGAQRNWAIDNLPLKYEWQLHLDADEYLSNELVSEINALQQTENVDGYFVPRLTRILGRDLWHGGLYPIWHMRLFRSGKGRCEDRRYDQHFLLSGKTAQLRSPMIDDNRMSLSEWVSRHNRWADAEAAELMNPTVGGLVTPNLHGTAIERKRALRGIYSRLPLFARAFLFFLYRYFLRLGFLDGIPGMIYLVLQSFWFRFLVDSKIYEARLREMGSDLPIQPAQSSPNIR
jgi:glycosyltransferase involved in cell wall biosynthesis